MVGSDQVWNPAITRQYSDIFFLNFGGDGVRRISYASSFGEDKWNFPQKTETYKSLLRKFAYLGCRESSGVKILQDTFDVKSTLVLDPTLLHDGYPELIGTPKESNNLVYYPLSSSSQLSEYSRDLAKRLGLTAHNANWQVKIARSLLWNRNSIEGWVKDIAEAKFVITPSFHGVAFSIIYNRQFAVLVSNKARATRITNILELLNLSDRIYYSIEELELDKPWLKPIDYDTVNIRLNNLRSESIQYLKDSLL
jgi:hypothetical protein